PRPGLRARRQPSQLRQLRRACRAAGADAEAGAVRSANLGWPAGGGGARRRGRVPGRGRRAGSVPVGHWRNGGATAIRGSGDLMRADSSNYRDIFLNDRPLMDARAPIEFHKGAFPNAINLPLMDDVERQKVGTCYKQHGQKAAIELGHRLVCGTLKEQRLRAWADFARANPEGYLYCFRGGFGPRTVQQWLRSDMAIDSPRGVAAYKAMRTFLIDTTEQAMAQCRFVILGGYTGTGKTEVLARLPNALDLEGHANHRGSSFGRHATPQPAQIDFDNRLAIDILRKRAAGIEHFVLEDEGRMVGSCSLPLTMC